MRDVLFPIDLQLFAEGGSASAGGDGAGQGATGVAAPAAGVQTKGVKNPLANVVYGKQPAAEAPAAEVQTETQPSQTVDKNAEFENLIKGDYKEVYEKRMSDTIRQRLKGANETAAKYEATLPLLDMLAARYGTDAADPAALMKAIEADDDFLSEAAADKGMDGKAYNGFVRLERENARLRASEAERQRQAQLDQQYSMWEQQAEKARAKYPNLDMNVESQNPQFRQLLLAGIDVGTAYAAIHQDDIVAGAMQYATQTAQQKVANSVAAGSKRPVENGMNGQSAATIKSDPSKWTKADRAEVAKRVARGEKIYL